MASVQVVQPLHRAGGADNEDFGARPQVVSSEESTPWEELWDFFGVYDGHGGRAEVDHVEERCPKLELFEGLWDG